MPELRPTVLVIAGSDSSGGAGLQRDLLALADAVREAARPHPAPVDPAAGPTPLRSPETSPKGRRGHLRVVPPTG